MGAIRNPKSSIRSLPWPFCFLILTVLFLASTLDPSGVPAGTRSTAEGARPSHLSRPPGLPSQWSGLAPTLEVFEDLDARDEQNRPVIGSQARHQVRALFLAGLTERLFESELYTTRQVLSFLNSFSLLLHRLGSGVQRWIHGPVQALGPSRRPVSVTFSKIPLFLALVTLSHLLSAWAPLPRRLGLAKVVLRC